MDIVAVIAAKGTSMRVPNKNIKPFGNTNLLEHKINQLQQVDGLTNIYVNSESTDILKVATSAGAQIIKRDPYYSTNTVPINEVYKNVVSSVPHEHIMFVHITSPLIKIQTLNECIKLYKKFYGEYDSLATVTALHKFMWYKKEAVNYDPSKMPRSQDLPDYYALNFAVNILPKQLIIDRKNIIGEKFYPVYLDEIESYDIDNPIEFKIAEQIFLMENE